MSLVREPVMTRRLIIQFVSALVILTAALPAPADPPDAPSLPATFDVPAVDAYVARQVRDKDFVGLAVTVMRDGKVILAKGYGKASLPDGPEVTTDTPFAIGSVTKQFTCACVLLLAEEGKLSVQDRVAKYYPHL